MPSILLLAIRGASPLRNQTEAAQLGGMTLSWREAHLPDIVSALAQRPGHEAVRTHLAEILRHAFHADYLALDHEVRMPEIRGRADMLFGATVFEFKRDLRREMGDVLTPAA